LPPHLWLDAETPTRTIGDWNWWLPPFAAKALFVRPSRAPERPALDSA
jgi:hypothetical protein